MSNKKYAHAIIADEINLKKTNPELRRTFWDEQKTSIRVRKPRCMTDANVSFLFVSADIFYGNFVHL